MSELAESAQRQSDLVDKIAEVAFQRGKITRNVEINSKLREALVTNRIDYKTYASVAAILDEVK